MTEQHPTDQDAEQIIEVIKFKPVWNGRRYETRTPLERVRLADGREVFRKQRQPS